MGYFSLAAAATAAAAAALELLWHSDRRLISYQIIHTTKHFHSLFHKNVFDSIFLHHTRSTRVLIQIQTVQLRDPRSEAFKIFINNKLNHSDFSPLLGWLAVSTSEAKPTCVCGKNVQTRSFEWILLDRHFLLSTRCRRHTLFNKSSSAFHWVYVWLVRENSLPKYIANNPPTEENSSASQTASKHTLSTDRDD